MRLPSNSRELAYIARAVAMTTRSGRMRASRSTNGSHWETTSLANSARRSWSSSVAAAASGVLYTYCQRNSWGAGRRSVSFVAWWEREEKKAVVEDLAWVDESITYTQEKVSAILGTIRSGESVSDALRRLERRS